MIFKSFLESLKVPLDSWEDLVIGGLFLMFSVFLVPLIFLNGYIIKSIRNFLRRRGEIPDWEGWPSLFKDGVSATVILLSYLIVILLISLSISGISQGMRIQNLSGGYESPQLGFSGSPAKILGYGFLTGLVSIVVLALIPMSYIAYAATGNLISGYKLHEIIVAIGASPFNYFKVFFLNVLTFIGVVFLGLIPIVGPFLIPFALFYLIMVFARMYTRNYLEVTS